MKFEFCTADVRDTPAVFQLIRDRIRWMDETGIEQWNKEDYWAFYPESYYVKAALDRQLFVLRELETGKISSTGVLLFQDRRWPDDGLAVYLHNFTSALNAKGAGGRFLSCAEDYARQNRKIFFRLDCMASNSQLNAYYESHGFSAVGHVEEQGYCGILREKKLAAEL